MHYNIIVIFLSSALGHPEIDEHFDIYLTYHIQPTLPCLVAGERVGLHWVVYPAMNYGAIHI